MESGVSRKHRNCYRYYFKFACRTGCDDASLPQCAICKETLASYSMRYCIILTLSSHFLWPSLFSFVIESLQELQTQKKSHGVIYHIEHHGTKASFCVALPRVLAGKPHNIWLNVSYIHAFPDCVFWNVLVTSNSKCKYLKSRLQIIL